MTTLDEITKEKLRVSEALARLDAQREKLTGQLSALEATERVLARYSKGTRAKETAPAITPTTTKNATTPTRSRGRPRTTTVKTAARKRSSPSLADQVLALATGKTQQEIAAACKGLARTTSVPPSRGISGLAASKSATGNSTARRRWSNPPWSDAKTSAREPLA